MAAALWLIPLLLLLSLAVTYCAGILYGAPMLEPGGVRTWQDEVQWILARLDFGWFAVITVLYWRGRRSPIVAGLACFVVNNCIWFAFVLAL